MLEISFRSEFLYLLALLFKAFTCFLGAFSFGDHHGVYLVFGKNGGKHFLPISPILLPIAVVGYRRVFEERLQHSNSLYLFVLCLSVSSCALEGRD